MRWLITTWRSRTGLLLAAYLLLAVTEAALFHLVHVSGSNHGPGSEWAAVQDSKNDFPGLGTGYDVLAYAFFTWRIWRRGPNSWCFSVFWKILTIIWALLAAAAWPGPCLAAILAVSLVSTALLYAPAVHDRIFGPPRRGIRAWARRLASRRSRPPCAAAQ
jgi:hypothetical protein